MNFTRQNIVNRTVLARCCYADMIIDMMEASASGDTELYNCMKKKAWMLRYAITQMCEYESDNIFGANVGDDPTAQAYVAVNTTTFPTSVAGATTLTSLKFSGGKGVSGAVDIATPGLSLSTGVDKYYNIVSKISKDINSYSRANKYTDGIYDIKSTIDIAGVKAAAPELITTVTYDRSSFGAAVAASITYSDSAGTVVTTTLDSDSEATASASSSFTNNMARKFLNQMDEYCGCPCGDNSNLTNDTLPKYI